MDMEEGCVTVLKVFFISIRIQNKLNTFICDKENRTCKAKQFSYMISYREPKIYYVMMARTIVLNIGYI